MITRRRIDLPDWNHHRRRSCVLDTSSWRSGDSVYGQRKCTLHTQRTNSISV